MTTASRLNVRRFEKRHSFDRSTSDQISRRPPGSLASRRASMTDYTESENKLAKLRSRNVSLERLKVTERSSVDRIQTYSSLPPSPIPVSPPEEISSRTSVPQLQTLWDYLREELTTTELYSQGQDVKWERISNFLSIPLAIEKVCCQVIILVHSC